MPGKSSLNSLRTEVTAMKQTNALCRILPIGLVLFLIATAIAGIISFHYSVRKMCDEKFEEGYKAACADFYKGSIKMELKEQPNGELLWVKKGELK